MSTTRRTFLTALCTLPGLRWLRPAPPAAASYISGTAIAAAQREQWARLNALLDEWHNVPLTFPPYPLNPEPTFELWPQPKIGDTITVRRPARFSETGEDLWPERLRNRLGCS